MSYLKQITMVFLIAILGVGSVMATEEAKYTVTLTEDDFEVRAYQPHILAETIVEGKFDGAGNKAFGRLFKYITGNNTSRQSIQMTAPVAQAPESEKIKMTSPVGQQQVNDNWAVSFMMPASSSINTLPEPKDPRIVLRQVPARNMAALRYSGTWSKKSYARHKDRLEAWIKAKGFNVTGEAVWARYDPPFKPWFLRRNEILIPITLAQDSE
ncbi:MAG TPA: heme-binding protein [Gammaproteobacteria bacterium]|nr:heme-binding protein [Gammaproteobacteria bacterium]